jgi:hypothetical protein
MITPYIPEQKGSIKAGNKENESWRFLRQLLPNYVVRGQTALFTMEITVKHFIAALSECERKGNNILDSSRRL